MSDRWSRGCKDSQKVLVPPARHISTSFQDIVDQLAEHNEQRSNDQYRTISEQLDFAALHDFQIVRRRLKQGFKPFNDAALKHKSKLHNLGEGKANSDEVEFLEDLYALLKAAHFRVLSTEEWDAACNNDFTFTNPMDVAWHAIDNKMLTRFWEKKADEFKHAAALSDRVLVMHRGIKLSHAKGKFFQEKVDLLVEYLIMDPLQKHVTPFLQKYKISWRDYWPTIEVVGSRDTGLQRGHGNNLYKAPKRGISSRDPLLDLDYARWVTRITLRDVLPNSSSVFHLFFKEISLQEPTFKDAIILYRRKLSSQQKENGNVGDYARNIFIKRFQDIPIADLEMVFPDKTVYLKPVLLLQLLFTIVLGLISVIITLLTSEATWSVLGGILSVVGTRAYQVYSSATLGRQKVLDDITDRLYDQTMDAQDGVIYFLLDQMADQHVKELLLAYFLLLDAERSLTQKQLDKKCEEFLQFQFGEKLDFALENSLPALLEDGLIKKDSQGLLSAVPFEEAKKLLARKGSAFFHESNEGQFKSNIPAFSRLSSRSLKKYIKSTGGSAADLQNSLAPRSEGAKPPLPPQEGLAQPQQVPVDTYNYPPVSPHSTSSQNTVQIQKPQVMYEDDEPTQTPDHRTELDKPQIALVQQTGQMRPRSGHALEGSSGVGEVSIAFNAQESRL